MLGFGGFYLADRNKTKNVRIWDGYGVGFWQMMTVLSITLLVLGAMTFVFAGLRILYGDRWFMWFVIAGCGIAGVAFAIFCISLFPKWGTLVRRIRLAEARMEGAMAISEINKYEEREDRRSTEIKDRMAESLGRVGRDILDTREKVDNLDAKLQGVNSSLQSYIIKAVKDITSAQARDRKLDNMMMELEHMVGKRISDLDQVVKNLQTQMAYQSEILERTAMNGQKDVENKPFVAAPFETASSGQEDKPSEQDVKNTPPDDKDVPMNDDDNIPMPDEEQEYSGSLEDADDKDKVEFEKDDPPQDGYDDSWEADVLSSDDDSDFF